MILGSYSSESHGYCSRKDKGLRMRSMSKEVQNVKDFGEFIFLIIKGFHFEEEKFQVPLVEKRN